ncbi:MAG: hypothetical protein JHC38_04435 [Thiotrichales bacterium]|jgi:hypothetical protein|nr:hypothetical protein [Thiotrichales bacterium]
MKKPRTSWYRVGIILLLVILGWQRGLAANNMENEQPVVLFVSQKSDAERQASQAVLAGLKQRLGANTPIKLIDTAQYTTIAKAWHAVMQLKPLAVVGPMQRDDVRALLALKPQLPVIALNQTEESSPHVWQFALQSELPIYQLATHLAEKGIDQLLLLTHQSTTALKLSQTLLSVADAKFVDRVSYKNAQQIMPATALLLRTTKGKQRILALETLLGESVNGHPWMRQDADALIVIAPLEDALALSYQVDYLWGQDLSLYWIDSGTNQLKDYVHSAANWGRMKTILPNYVVSAMQPNEREEGIAKSFFSALGEDAGQLLQLNLANNGAWLDGSVLTGQMGELTLDSDNRVQVKLPIVWLGDGHVDIVEE